MSPHNRIDLARDADTGVKTLRAHFEGHAYDPHWHDSYLVGRNRTRRPAIQLPTNKTPEHAELGISPTKQQRLKQLMGLLLLVSAWLNFIPS
ncbi:hypothetical protein J3D54_004528 [Pseudomonas sp. GGS8]|nr:hypothetical protein [Pseudomonas sp. GGS8]